MVSYNITKNSNIAAIIFRLASKIKSKIAILAIFDDFFFEIAPKKFITTHIRPKIVYIAKQICTDDWSKNYDDPSNNFRAK